MRPEHHLWIGRLEGEARLEVKAMAGRKVDATVLSIPARFPLSKYFRHKQVAAASASCRNCKVAASAATENVSLENLREIFGTFSATT